MRNEQLLRPNSHVEFPESTELANRRKAAREALEASGKHADRERFSALRSLRRRLESSVAKGDTENAKRLTKATFDAMGVRPQ